MKITREDLIHIIKEELEAVTGLQEQEAQEGEEVVQKAMQIKDNPKVQAMFEHEKLGPRIKESLVRRGGSDKCSVRSVRVCFFGISTSLAQLP